MAVAEGVEGTITVPAEVEVEAEVVEGGEGMVAVEEREVVEAEVAGRLAAREVWPMTTITGGLEMIMKTNFQERAMTILTIH